MLLVFFILGKFTPIGEWFNLESITKAIRNAGPWGYLAFIAIMTAGCFLQISAMLFVLAAILTYGQVEGTVLGFAGLIVAMLTNFVVVRRVGGKAVADIKKPFIKKMLSKLDDKPITTIFLLRTVLWASPFLNYILAMTKVKFSKYAIGSIVGIIIPLAIFSTLVYFFREWFV